jgi:hypothetical protein
MTALDPIKGAAPSRRMRSDITIDMPSRDCATGDLLIEIGSVFIVWNSPGANESVVIRKFE